MTDTTQTIDDVLAKLQAELAQVEAERARAEKEVDSMTARISVLTHRITSIQGARWTLGKLPSLDPDQAWRDHLIAWRKTLADELSALPSPIRDARTFGLQTNLILSLRAIDLGPEVTNGTGYSLSTLRLGRLMMESGYAVVGADPDHHYAGALPWPGSLPQVERRIANVQKERGEAEAVLADAMFDDDERERHAANPDDRIVEVTST